MVTLIVYLWMVIKHKLWVFWYISKFCFCLLYRGVVHDLSKFSIAEIKGFAPVSRAILAVPYESVEYNRLRATQQHIIDLHHSRNSHHPEHYKNLVDGMSLYDVVEMWCDWQAAIRKNPGGNILVSIDRNADLFRMSDQIISILRNSV